MTQLEKSVMCVLLCWFMKIQTIKFCCTHSAYYTYLNDPQNHFNAELKLQSQSNRTTQVT